MTKPKATTSESFHRDANREYKVADGRIAAEPLPFAAGAKPRPLLLGHRGARPLSRFKRNRRDEGIPPENSLACFEYALAHGCDGFEFDVRITRDGRLVLCHNAWLRRYKVAASRFDSLCSRCGETLPCLEDVLAAFGGRAFMDIVVKVPGGEELIVKALRKGKPRHFLLSSFLPEVLLKFHQLDPSLPLGYVCDHSANVRIWRDLPIQVFLPHYELVTEKLVHAVHNRSLQIFTWTVNREGDMRQLSAWRIDGLISDDPSLLYRTFQPLASPAKSQ